MINTSLSPPLSTSSLLKMKNLRQMKMICALLLIFCIMMSILLEIFSPQEKNIFWIFIIGFFEAAVVGAMADWYAVVALFKHPLNLSFLPHTAIIPHKKDEIGKNLGKFMLDNFMQDEVVIAKVKEFDPLGKLFSWIEKSEKEHTVSRFITDILGKLLDSKNSTHINEFATQNIVTLIEKTDLASFLAKLINLGNNDQYRNPLLDRILDYGLNYIIDNKERWIELAKSEGVWGTKWIGSKYVDGFLNDVIQKIVEVKSAPDHAIKIELKNRIHRLIHDLQHDPKVIEAVNTFKKDLVTNPHFVNFINSTVGEIVDNIRRDLNAEDSFIAKQIHLSLMKSVHHYRTDAQFDAHLNSLVNELVEWLLRHKEWIAEHLSTQIQSWSPGDMSRTLELEIGSDLQWIRISGTLVGGLVGAIFSSLLFLLH